MDETELINLIQIRHDTLMDYYNSIARGTRRSKILIKCEELNYLITFIKNQSKKSK